jgi:hypothetical protein
VSSRNHLLFYFHGPILAGYDARPGRAVDAFDALYPNERLRFAIRPDATLEELSDVHAWFNEHISRGEDPSIYHDSEDRLIKLRWSKASVATPGNRERFDLVIKTPLETQFSETAVELASRVVEAITPWHGMVLTHASIMALDGQIVRDPTCATQAPFGLPHLFYADHLRSHLAPQELGWINYWSAETCAHLGYTDDDGRLFASVRTTSDGGRVLTLTSDVLDPESRPDHVDALRVVYERYPRIGGRSR